MPGQHPGGPGLRGAQPLRPGGARWAPTPPATPGRAGRAISRAVSGPAPRCSRPWAPAVIMRQSAVTTVPGLRRRQARGQHISISQAFLFVLLCSFSSPNARHIPRRVRAAGLPKQSAAALVLKTQRLQGRLSCPWEGVVPALG